MAEINFYPLFHPCNPIFLNYLYCSPLAVHYCSENGWYIYYTVPNSCRPKSKAYQGSKTPTKWIFPCLDRQILTSLLSFPFLEEKFSLTMIALQVWKLMVKYCVCSRTQIRYLDPKEIWVEAYALPHTFSVNLNQIFNIFKCLQIEASQWKLGLKYFWKSYCVLICNCKDLSTFNNLVCISVHAV